MLLIWIHFITIWPNTFISQVSLISVLTWFGKYLDYSFYSRKDCRGGTTRVQNRFWVRNSEYAGGPWDGSKVIEGGIVTWRHIHEILRWLNFLASTETRFEILTASNSEPSQSFWSEKVSHLGVWSRDRRFWANLKLRHLKISCICLHMTIPPSMTFWAISRTPA